MPEFLKKSLRIIDHILVIGLSAMSLMVFWNVVLRYVFNSGIPFSVEVSRLIFVWIVFLGSVVALGHGLHMSMDSHIARFPRPVRLICFVACNGLMLWCCWLLWQGSWIQTKLNWNNHAPISGLSVGFLYAAGLVAALFMALILLSTLWRSRSGQLFGVWAGKPAAPLEVLSPSEERS